MLNITCSEVCIKTGKHHETMAAAIDRTIKKNKTSYLFEVIPQGAIEVGIVKSVKTKEPGKVVIFMKNKKVQIVNAKQNLLYEALDDTEVTIVNKRSKKTYLIADEW